MKKFVLMCSLLATAACSPQKSLHSAEAEDSQSLLNRAAIIGGEAAKPTDLVTRSTVSFILDDAGVPISFCTGTLISKDLVLTATHCLFDLDADEIQVFFGSKLPTRMTDANLRKVHSFKRNPEYLDIYDDEDNYMTGFGDVALVRLSSPAPEGFSPVPVLSRRAVLPGGQSMLLAGFGLVDDDKAIVAEGLNSVRISLVGHSSYEILVTDQRAGRGACAGDSGGPAYLETAQGLFVYGITRGPHDLAPHCHAYGEYTYASAYESFILQSAKELGAELPQFLVPAGVATGPVWQ